MTQEVKDYATKKILESGIRMVPGHYPDFRDKEHVDMWLKMSQRTFEMCFGKMDRVESGFFPALWEDEE